MRPHFAFVGLRRNSALLVIPQAGMMGRLVFGCLFAALLLAAPAWSAAPPARLTAAHQKVLQESERQFQQVNALFKQGKTIEAIKATRRGLALQREVFGRIPLSRCDWLEWMAGELQHREDFRGAEQALSEVLSVRRRALGEGHWKTTDARLALAHSQRLAGLGAEQRNRLREVAMWDSRVVQLHRQGKYVEALPVAHRVVDLRKALLGERHHDYATSLSNLAAIYNAIGDYKRALPFYQQSLNLRKEVQGERHPSYASSLNSMASLYQAMGNHKKALPLYQQALMLRKDLLGERHPYFANTLNDLALLYKAMGDYRQALPLFQQSVSLSKEVLGEKHPSYATSLNNLAGLHKDMGNYKQALSLYQQALKLTKQVLGEGHPYYAASLNNLAVLYDEMGDRRQALRLYQQALKLTREVRGERHHEYAASLNNVAGLHKVRGDHHQALPLCQQALKLTREVRGERHPDYADSLNNLAGLYQDMGDHKQALPLYQQALKLRREVLGDKHPNYAASLNDLGLLHYAMRNYKQALPLYQQALKLRKEVLGDKHPDYAASLSNLALVHSSMGDYKLALPLHQQALKLTREVRGERHHDYATNLNNLAGLHQDIGDYRQTLPLYQQALKLRKEVLGEKHPAYASTLYNLAELHQAFHDGKQARSFSDQALAITRDNLLLAASVQSERQQLSATQDVRHYLDLRLSLPDPVAEGAAASYRHALAWKGAVFARQQQRRLFARLLATDSRAEVRGLVEELQQATRLLAAAALAPTDSTRATVRREYLEKLTRQKEDLEARLSGLSSEFRATQKRIAITPQALHQRLPAGVVLVDFLFYTRHDHTQIDRAKRFQRRLTAFVLRKDRAVVRIDLGPAAAVEQALTSWRRTMGKKQRGKEDVGQILRKLLWLPLQQHVADAKVVLISPDGALAKLPFAALPGSKEGVYLLEEVALAVVPVPQLLPELLAPVPKGTRLKPSLLIVGDVDFDSAEKVAASADDRSAPRGGLKGWQRLAATADEASAVKDSFSRLFKGGTVTDLREEEARKSAVRQALQKSRYAHLATHGFFAPAELKSALVVREGDERLFGQGGVSGWHPLLLSGVVLSGANKEAKPGEEDGILTALEVSEMDLSGLELAVLSACETGLGQEASGEGLLGLQRAFAVAGTRSVVASLWKVPDRATQSLMAEFYRVAWDRKSVVSRVEALRRAQLAMLREGVKRGMLREGIKRGMLRREDEVDSKQRLLPYYWAAFVLSGDWR